jgi:hypothetical protein
MQAAAGEGHGARTLAAQYPDQIATARKLMLPALAAVLATLALGTPAANAADCAAPSISGTAEVGGTVSAKAGTCSDPFFAPDIQLEWYRCTGTTPDSCGAEPVKAAQPSPSSYAPAAEDVGARLGVKQTARGGFPPGTDEEWAFTGVVPQPPTTPPPPPPPPPGGGGNATPLLAPFPVVTIAGRLTRQGGARLTRVSVRAPSGSSVLVRCQGCRPRSARFTVGERGALRLRRFQRRLRPGAVLELVITKPGFVGKYTSFLIRRRRPPVRTELCVLPGTTDGSACPA